MKSKYIKSEFYDTMMKMINNITHIGQAQAWIFFIAVVSVVIVLALLIYMGIVATQQAQYQRTETSYESQVVTTHSEHKFLLNHTINNLIQKHTIDADVHYLADTACNEVYVPACSNLDRLMGANEEGKID